MANVCIVTFSYIKSWFNFRQVRKNKISPLHQSRFPSVSNFGGFLAVMSFWQL